MAREILVVGAGFAGSVCARELATAGYAVRLVDRRPHVGGNAFDKHDENGILIHPYGPHIFHTNSERIFKYLSRFTEWRFYEHRVLSDLGDRRLPIPINRTTINEFYGLNLDEAGVAAFLDKVRLPRSPIVTSEDVVLNTVGRELCDAFFRGYTRKQWDLELSDLSAGVAARVPTRTNDDDRYFTDQFQFMPAKGYAPLFNNLLDHPNIRVELGTDYASIDSSRFGGTVFTGPIDGYFGHVFGALPYRSLRFEHVHLPDSAQYQMVGTVNYPNHEAFTRITEFKHLTGQNAPGTSIVREYALADGDPYYPIPRPENETLYQRYKKLAAGETDVIFVGRLAQYRYYNMDQVVGAALNATEPWATAGAA